MPLSSLNGMTCLNAVKGAGIVLSTHNSKHNEGHLLYLVPYTFMPSHIHTESHFYSPYILRDTHTSTYIFPNDTYAQNVQRCTRCEHLLEMQTSEACKAPCAHHKGSLCSSGAL